ncbi:PilZ domain-containing protein [uncultured Paraglaciecola sp.]|uniref:PilZ domain-containing protein n=1 Tax=uncultured Paraglaciecola sp. TaxID=1765024 RepID=UPI0030DC8178|tara:strand:+ start:2755 stop:3378 length:624 start_codon:yes stop_codon:yes gene_type:complete
MLTSEPSSSILQILELSIWPILIIAVVLILRNSINKIMNRFSSADDLKMSVGSLSIQAKAMRELNQSIDLGFNDTTLKKSQIEALIDAKIRSIQAAIDFEITKTEIRADPRSIESKEILITTQDGEDFTGKTMDISEAGVGFRSNARFGFHDIVAIKMVSEQDAVSASESLTNRLKIVRIEQAKEGFYYGASMPTSNESPHNIKQKQ